MSEERKNGIGPRIDCYGAKTSGHRIISKTNVRPSVFISTVPGDPFKLSSFFQNSEVETALHCAAQHGHAGAVRSLLEYGADPNIKNSKEETPLDLAALYGRLEKDSLTLNRH